jgi:hypothetical protein
VIKIGHHEDVKDSHREKYGPKEHILLVLHHLDDMNEDGLMPTRLKDLGGMGGIKIVTRLDALSSQSEN